MKQVMEKEELQDFLSDNVKDAWNTTCKAESKYREEYFKKNVIKKMKLPHTGHTHMFYIYIRWEQGLGNHVVEHWQR